MYLPILVLASPVPNQLPWAMAPDTQQGPSLPRRQERLQGRPQLSVTRISEAIEIGLPPSEAQLACG